MIVTAPLGERQLVTTVASLPPLAEIAKSSYEDR